MVDFLKNKVVTALIVIATVILAGVAIFTAYRLYQSGTEPDQAGRYQKNIEPQRIGIIQPVQAGIGRLYLSLRDIPSGTQGGS